MENTIVNEVVKNEEVTPVVEQVAKHSAINGGVIALAITGVAVAGYGIWKGAKKLKEVYDAKKETEDEAAKEHQFFVPNN